MKKLRFSRKQIVLALQADLLALFLAAGHAKAQFIYDGQTGQDKLSVHSYPGTTNTLTGSGTFSGYFVDSGTGKNTVTIAGGAAITNTISGSVIEFGQSGGAGGSVTNHGTLSDTASGIATAAVDIGTGSAFLGLTNAGTINSRNGSTSYGVKAEASGTGAITITNTSAGTIKSDSSDNSIGMDVTGNGGPVTINNGGSISEFGNYFGPATGVSASNTGGGISIANSGSLTASGYGYFEGSVGMSINIAGAGNLTLTNSGSIGTSASGFYGTSTAASLSTTTGDITVTNPGSISASGYEGQGMVIDSGGAITLTNAGSIVGNGNNYQGQEGFGPTSNVGLSATGIKNVSITNSGYIRGTASTYASNGSAEGIDAFSSAGSVYIDSTSTVNAYNGLFGSSIGIYAANNASAGITVLNSASMSATSNGRNTFGIYVTTGGAQGFKSGATITNTGSLTTSSFYATVGIEVITSGLLAQVTNGTGGSIGARGGSGSTGIQIQDTLGNDVIVNEGSITSNGAGIEDLGIGNITLNNEGGSISAAGGKPAIQLGSGNNKVTVTLPSMISGLIDGGKAHAYNTLTFTGNGATPAQLATFRTVAAESAATPTGTYSVTLGSATFTFTDFNVVKITH